MTLRAWAPLAIAIAALACGSAGGGEPAEPAAPRLAFAIASDAVSAEEVAGGAALARVVLSEETTGNGDASLSIVWLDSGAELALPSGPESATLAFALSGEGELVGDRREGDNLRAGDAAYGSPGAAVRVRAGDEPVELVVAYAPAGPEAGFLAGARGGEAGGEGDVTWLPDDAAASYELAGGLGEVAIYADEVSVGDGTASLGVLTAGPGMAVPAHTHDDASEYLFLLQGAGAMRAGDESLAVGAGMGIQVPRGVEHAFEVLGDEPVRAVQVYAPAGPEQRFKQ